MTDFTQEQVGLAIDHVAERGAENRASPVIYTQVFEAAGMADPQQLHHSGQGQLVTEFMEAFHHRCIARDYPPLDALVINATGERGGLPGIGYFTVNGLPDPLKPSTSEADAIRATAHWEGQKNECKRWGQERRRSTRRPEA